MYFQGPLGLSGLGDAAPAPVSQGKWENIGKGLRKKVRKYAGMNVPGECPPGFTRDGPPRYAEERGRGRWICRDASGKNYLVWNRKKRDWDSRLLHCPAVRGWGRKVKAPCQKVKKKNIFERAVDVVKDAPGAIKGSVVKIGKVTVDLALLPYREMLKISLTAGKVLCGLPRPVLIAAATAAGVPPPTAIAVVPVFCEVVKSGKIRSLKDLKRIIPIALAIVAKVGVARQQVTSEAQQEAMRQEIENQATDVGVDALTNLIEDQIPGAEDAARLTQEAIDAERKFTEKVAPKLTASRVAAMKRAVKMLRSQGRIQQALKIEAQLRVAGELSGAALRGALRGYSDPMIIALANAEEAMSGLNETEIALLASFGEVDPAVVDEIIEDIPDEEVRKAFSLSRKVAFGVGGGAVLLAAGFGLYFAFRD